MKDEEYENMDNHAIEFKVGSGDWEFWAWFDGARREACVAAARLHESLRVDEGHTRVSVRVNGRRLTCTTINDCLKGDAHEGHEGSRS